MSRGTIELIQNAEDRAEATVAEARRTAEALRVNAEREGEIYCKTTREESAKELAATLEQIRTRAMSMTERLAEEAREEAEALRVAVALRRRIAEKNVMRGLMSKCR